MLRLVNLYKDYKLSQARVEKAKKSVKHKTVERYGPPLPSNSIPGVSFANAVLQTWDSETSPAVARMPPKPKTRGRSRSPKVGTNSRPRPKSRSRSRSPSTRRPVRPRQPRKGSVASFSSTRKPRVLPLPATGSANSLDTHCEFYGARAPNGQLGLGMRGTVPIAKVGEAGGSVSGAGALLNQNGGYVKNYQLSPLNSYQWFHPGVPAMAAVFERYKVKSCTFHYRATGGTTNASTPFTFGYSDDPLSPDVYLAGSPTEASIMSAEFQHDFPGWSNWDYPVRVDTGATYFMSQTGSDAADTRMQRFGVIALLQLFSAAAGNGTEGKLYMSFDFEFFEFEKTAAATGDAVDRIQPVKGQIARARMPLVEEEKCPPRRQVPVPIVTGMPLVVSQPTPDVLVLNEQESPVLVSKN